MSRYITLRCATARKTFLLRLIVLSALPMVMSQSLLAQPPSGFPWLEEMVVDKKLFLVKLLAPYNRIKIPTPPVLGNYIWRFTVEASDKYSFVLAADTALQTNDYAQIVKASTLRLCRDPNVVSSLECREKVKGTAELKSNNLTVTISDTAIVNRINAARPTNYVRIMFEPGGRYGRDVFRIRYLN